jgi:hypothetical protein
MCTSPTPTSVLSNLMANGLVSRIGVAKPPAAGSNSISRLSSCFLPDTPSPTAPQSSPSASAADTCSTVGSSTRAQFSPTHGSSLTWKNFCAMKGAHAKRQGKSHSQGFKEARPDFLTRSRAPFFGSGLSVFFVIGAT